MTLFSSTLNTHFSDSAAAAAVFLQVKYKESVKDMSNSLYSTMADTSETSFARGMMDVLSEVNTVNIQLRSGSGR